MSQHTAEIKIEIIDKLVPMEVCPQIVNMAPSLEWKTLYILQSLQNLEVIRQTFNCFRAEVVIPPRKWFNEISDLVLQNVSSYTRDSQPFFETMYSFTISTDKHVPLKFLITKTLSKITYIH